MLKTETRLIGEYEYEVTQLDAVRARRVFLKLSQLVAPVFAEVAAARATSDGKDEGQTQAAFITAIAKLSNSMTPEDLDFFCDQFASSTCVVMSDDGGKRRAPKLTEIQKLHFIGERFTDQFAWLAFCLEVNFSSFFQRLGLRLGT